MRRQGGKPGLRRSDWGGKEWKSSLKSSESVVMMSLLLTSAERVSFSTLFHPASAKSSKHFCF